MDGQFPPGLDYAILAGAAFGLGYATCALLDRLAKGARWW